MMKTCGKTMRMIAVIAFIVLCGCMIANYAISMDEHNESRDKYAEDFAEHRIEILRQETNGGFHDEEDCSTCQKAEKLDQQAIVLFSGFVQSILTYLLYCSILYVLGEMALAKASCKTNAPLPREPEAPVPKVCPNCGNVLDAENRFCNLCGTELR